jgi:hypothetical protein
MRPRRTAAVVAVSAFFASRPAGAVENEHQFGGDAGGSILWVGDKHGPDVGGGIGVHYTYGLNDAFNLMAEGAWSVVALGENVAGASTPRTRPTNLTNAGIGVGYVFDVLRWVPYAGALLEGYALNGGTIAGTRVLPGVAAGGGIDYRFGRSWAAGAAVRWHFLLTDASTYPSFVQVFGRFEYTWGW